MKYVFFGGQDSPFAQIILDGLTQAGYPPLSAYRNAKENIDIEKLRSFGADFFLVAAFGKILKKEVLNISPISPIGPIGPIPIIGVHPSLLPKYRGPSPIQSAILNDEKETGVTLFLIDEKVDHGSVLSEKRIAISEKDTYKTLEEKLAELSVKLILETIPKRLNGELKPEIQNEIEATYTKKFTTENAEVNLEKDSPKKIWLKIRALNPEPGAYTILKLKNGKELRLKLLEADLEDGNLKLLRVQPEGKKPMRYKDFLNGYQQYADLR